MNPVFLYHLFFKIVRPDIQNLIAEVEEKVLSWDGMHADTHPLGGRSFMFEGEEIGHIHWNGDLDLLFGRKLAEKLSVLKVAQPHTFVPAAITFPLTKADDVLLAVSLLRLSYLRFLNKYTGHCRVLDAYIENEISKLPIP